MDPDNPNVVLAAEIFSMLADVTRVRIVVALVSHDEMSVGELSKRVHKSPAAVSQHLAKLRLARIVVGRQEGTYVHYRLANEHVELLVRAALEQAEHAASDVPAHHRAQTAGLGTAAVTRSAGSTPSADVVADRAEVRR
ncbi:metalloregulator ArsR/SmtB family transcription factor [Raineyella sp. LH-20]|uniref:ArsR/SmtB family transcription factor n=1 Tax=Raineyella sp. LH-20 TaxID=3081204 RepID=UPI0029533BA9|nr:metalloregulator ArsR/SmtB family transcription factor [Raineyella sp. LH-20]WOP19789.1 metalloregulator ArsR/SmtB family transcription factor [Raineyella sp. LH-20]